MSFVKHVLPRSGPVVHSDVPSWTSLASKIFRRAAAIQLDLFQSGLQGAQSPGGRVAGKANELW